MKPGIGAAMVAALVSVSCFTAPNDPVLFACDPVAAPDCPDGYRCAADGCCHRNGTDVEANAGTCRLPGGVPTTGGSSSSDGTSSSSGAEDSTATGESSGPASSESSSGSTGTGSTGTGSTAASGSSASGSSESSG